MAHLKLELSNPAPARLPPSMRFVSMNFDARGQLILAGEDSNKTLTINDFDGDIITLPRPETSRHSFPVVQRFSDGRWLVVNSRCRADEPNASVYSAAFQKLNAFSVGDAVEHVAVDREDRIWVGYFDESGGRGLLRFTDQGETTYDFNAASGHNIFDLYAMTIGPPDDIWVYPYTDFYLARISQDRVKIVLAKSPVSGAHTIAIGKNHAAFFGSYKSNNVYVCHLASGRGRAVTLTIGGKTAPKPTRIATYGESVALLLDGQVFRTQLSALVAAAGL